MTEHAVWYGLTAFTSLLLAFGLPVMLLTWRTEIHEREMEMRKGQHYC